MKTIPTLYLFATLLTGLGAESKFTIETVRGKVTASWKGTADTSGIDLAPTDEDIAALAAYPKIEAIHISGTTRFMGKGFAALKDLPKLRELNFNGIGPERFSEMFPPGSLEGYHALAELDQVTTLRFGHVKMSVEGTAILLREMESLEYAGLGVFADDRIIQAAADAKNLKGLNFGHWATVPEKPLTAEGAAAFAKLQGLESLHTGEQDPPLGGSMKDLTQAVSKIQSLKSLTLAFSHVNKRNKPKNPVTVADLEPLSSLKNLERLGIQLAKLDSSAASKLTEFESVKRLSFSYVNLTEGTLTLLKTMPNLAVLELWSSCDWDDADLKALQSAKPSLRVNFVGRKKK